MMNLEDLQFVASYRTICSIYPENCTAMLDLGPTTSGGKTNYLIEGAPKGEFRTLRVEDAWESVIDFHNTDFVGQNKRMPRPESAEAIARQLVRDWTSGAGSGSGQQPGIMIIAKPEPSRAELDHLKVIQSACFEWLVHTARGFEHNHQWRNINEKHRIAGKWLGLKDKWIAEVGTDMDKGACAHCFSPLLDSRATVCAVCHKDQPAREAKTISVPKPVIEKVFKTSAVPLAPPLQPLTA